VRGDPPSAATVQFTDGSQRTVSLELSSVRLLNHDGFLAAAFLRPAEIRRLVSEQPEAVVRLVLLDSVDQTLETEEIRRQLVPDWVAERDWEKWWSKTREILKRHPEFDTSRARKQVYALRTEQRRRQDELLSNLSGATASQADRVGYLKELLEHHQREQLTDDELGRVRTQVLWLIDSASETWIKVQALILAAEFGWMADGDFRESMAALADRTIRWRPITRLGHFQMALTPLLDTVTKEAPIPPAVWSGMLGVPRSGRWLLDKMLFSCSVQQVEQAISEAFEAAFPSRGSLEAEPGWIVEFADILEDIRNDWRMFDPPRVLDWRRLGEMLLGCVKRLQPGDLEKERVAPAAVSIIRVALKWLSGSEGDPVASVISWLREGREGFAFQLPLVIEAVMGGDDEQFKASLVDQLAASQEPAALLLVSAKTERLPAADQVALLERLVSIGRTRLTALPVLTRRILERCVRIADAVGPQEKPRLLAVIQKASATQAEVHRSVTSLESRLWHDMLLAREPEVWSNAFEPYLLSPAFRDALQGLLNEAREEAEARTARIRQERDALEHELTEVREELARANSRVEQLARLREDQARQGPSLKPDRTLSELAGALAEVDRSAARQGLRPEAAGQLLKARLLRLLKQAGLTPIGSLGQLGVFNPSQHEVVEGKLGPNRQVEIQEIGYEQVKPDGTRVLVKPALVRATGE